MLDEFASTQPSLQSLVQRMSHELSAKAVILLHENGQVLQRSGWIEENEYPTMAALSAAMIAAGKSLNSLGEAAAESPSRFSCDSESIGLYLVAVTTNIWLVVLYDQPLNPGQFRMKVRRYSQIIARLGVNRAEQWELTNNGNSETKSGANLPPVSFGSVSEREEITAANSSLFANITDDEIDDLFVNTRS